MIELIGSYALLIGIVTIGDINNIGTILIGLIQGVKPNRKSPIQLLQKNLY